MRVSEFTKQFPNYAIDFEAQVRHQMRIYDGIILDQLLLELQPDHPYQSGSRGRPNLNQTLAHSQCATCHRVLRNDLFYTPPSLMKRNVVFSHCRECTQKQNSSRYETRADIIRSRRIVIWQYLAPRCAGCGFDKHISAIDLHHPENKENQLLELISEVALTLENGRVEKLMREATKCTPLCSNCHRMLHAGVITPPSQSPTSRYKFADLMLKLKSIR